MHIAMKIESGMTNFGKMELPDGCVGLSLIFKTKKQARKYYGKNITLMEVKILEKENV